MEKAIGIVGQGIDEREAQEKKTAEAERYWTLLLEIGEVLDSCFDAACDVARVPAMARETIASLRDDTARSRQQAERLAGENTVLANRVSELEQRLEGIEEWEKIPAFQGLVKSVYGSDLVRDQLADFALKVLQGQVGIVHRDA